MVFIVNLLFLFINLIFTARISFWLVQVFDVRNKRKWATILITLFYFAYFYLYVGTDIQAFIQAKIMPDFSDIILMLIPTGLIIWMYVMFIGQMYNIRIKNGRQREFERRMTGQGKSYAVLILIAILGIVGALFNAIYYLAKEPYGKQATIVTSFVVAGISLALLVLFIILHLKESKKAKSNEVQFVDVEAKVIKPKTPKNIILIIEDDNENYIFKGEVKTTFKDVIGNIESYYYVSNYGEYIDNTGNYELFGFKTSYLDKEVLNEIKLQRIYSKEIEAIIPHLEKNKRKVFNVELKEVSNENLVS